MSVALRLYDQLTEAADDKTRARLIAEAFEAVEERYPHVRELATQSDLTEKALLLQKEIKETEAKLQKEIKETEAKLQKEIKETEAKLQKEIRAIDLRIAETEVRLQKEINNLAIEIRAVEVRMVQLSHRQTLWLIGAAGGLLGLSRLLDYLLL